jgi:hypothetical protein
MLLRPAGIVRRRSIIRYPAVNVMRRRRGGQRPATAAPQVAPPAPLTGPPTRPSSYGS